MISARIRTGGRGAGGRTSSQFSWAPESSILSGLQKSSSDSLTARSARARAELRRSKSDSRVGRIGRRPRQPSVRGRGRPIRRLLPAHNADRRGASPLTYSLPQGIMYFLGDMWNMFSPFAPRVKPRKKKIFTQPKVDKTVAALHEVQRKRVAKNRRIIQEQNYRNESTEMPKLPRPKVHFFILRFPDTSFSQMPLTFSEREEMYPAMNSVNPFQV